MNRPDPVRCRIKACPCIGHWPSGGLCPMHAREAYLYDGQPLAGADDE